MILKKAAAILLTGSLFLGLLGCGAGTSQPTAKPAGAGEAPTQEEKKSVELLNVSYDPT